ncbi:MAG: hypothetical protein KAR19_12640 [Bacteroidales bacterium]|nr:hypothetical protein [Bacteroidales bacterium]
MKGVIIVAAVIIVLVIILSINPKSKTSNSNSTGTRPDRQERMRREALIPVFQRHKQILNESIGIIESSKKIDTIIGRKQVVLEKLDWFDKNSIPGTEFVLIPTPKDSRPKFMSIYNARLVDVAEHLVVEAESKTKSLKTKSGKQNHINKTIDAIQKITSELYAETENFEEAVTEIQKAYNKLENLDLSV